MPITLLRTKCALVGGRLAHVRNAVADEGHSGADAAKTLNHSGIKITMIFAKVADEFKNKTILQA